MYSWGDDTKAWKNPGSYDYGSARRGYLDELKKTADVKGPRSYGTGKGPNMALVDPKGKIISTQSKNPAAVLVDGTGSMQSWPAEIFDRMPLLYQTLSKYKDDFEVSFSVIGDARSDQWPVQVTDFGKGPVLDDYLKAVHAEGGGGPGIRESYELWAYYMLEHSKTPNATAPFMFIMGDEKFYETVNPEQVKHYLGDAMQPADAKAVWKALGQRYDIYLLRKPLEGYDKEVEAQWADAIGKQKIIPLYDPMRVVDVAMGIVARSWGNFGDFSKNLSARQDPESIEKVMLSLRATPEMDTGLKSKLKNETPAKKSKALGGTK
ncbi:hypothetical protein HY639_00490 [Candidatus Woesearchaeota archaeon]|nr:hypothetical protein [Candidatus Woesearchaeota archaeon]